MNWISVDDKTPRLHTRVLVLVNGKVDIGFFDVGENDVDFFYDKKGQSIFHYVSHWMPLPKPPTE